MSSTVNTVDPDGLMEFSVVFTDRSLNHMSAQFQGVMRDISNLLKEVYNADHVAVIPGGGTYAMEAVARQLGFGRRALVVQNGWFSFRWSQIMEAGAEQPGWPVLKARQAGNEPQSPFAPAPIAEVVAAIAEHRPAVVFAPHVETAAGIILPDDYISALAKAAHDVGALLVLDCIASGCIWIDMKALGVDVLISAPQKGWSSTPCAGLVMMNDAALTQVQERQSDSFALDLAKWHSIMAAYEGGGHAYHATLPTDGLKQLRDTMLECKSIGFDELKAAQWQLGDGVRAALADKGIRSVAAAGFGAPGVVVSYTSDAEVQSGRAFAAEGMQIAAGVPLRCGEGDDFSTFRIGLFGLDKLADPSACLARLQPLLDKLL